MVRLDLGHSLQGEVGSLTFEVDFSRLLLLREVWNVHLTYREPCDARLQVFWSGQTSPVTTPSSSDSIIDL